MSENGAGVSITSALQLMLMTSDPCHRLHQPLEVKLLPWLISPPTMDYRSMHRRQGVALSMTNHTPNFTFSVAGHRVDTKQEAKCWCLGYWWKSNLGSAKSVEANIEKGIKAFFAACAIGTYRSLNPLHSISLFNTCVVPTVLYGSENWILTE